MTSTIAHRAEELAQQARIETATGARRLMASLTHNELLALTVYYARNADLRSLITHHAEPDDDQHTEHALNLAARRFRCTTSDLLSKDRSQPVVEGRQVTAYALRLALGMSYPELGRRLHRDHTSVMHSVAKVGETPRLRRIASEIAIELGWRRDQDVA